MGNVGDTVALEYIKIPYILKKDFKKPVGSEHLLENSLPAKVWPILRSPSLPSSSSKISGFHQSLSTDAGKGTRGTKVRLTQNIIAESRKYNIDM